MKKTPKKSRKPRADQAQKKPVFADFTNSWGLAGRKWWDTEAQWFSQKIEHGKFLHPLLSRIVGELQKDYQCAVLKFLRSTDDIRESEVSNEVFWKLHQIHKKYQNREPLERDERRDLERWLTILTESQKRMDQLGKIVAGAVACGDIALLEHLILIMQFQRKPTDKPAKPKASVVEQAYDSVVLRRKKKLHLKSNPGLKGVALLLGVTREDQSLLKQIRLPSASDVDMEITKNRALKKLAPKWTNSVFESNRRKIQRVCKQTGRELSER